MLRVGANLAERGEPWSLFRSVLREILAEDATAATQLPGPMRSALAWLLPEFESQLADQERAEPDPRAAARCCWRLRPGCSAGAGAGLVVDDLQWADASSLWLLEAAVPRLVGIGAVLAYRPDELVAGAAASSFVTRARPTATFIELRSASTCRTSPDYQPTLP